MAKKKYYYRDKSGNLDWHDKPAPHYGKENATERSPSFGARGWATGLTSVGASVHSSQVGEFREDAKKHGFTGVDFKNDGTAVFYSRGERARYLKHRGLRDRNGGYSD
tara:strand:- start:1757 stop:2080 length:324 start_codon:yes stop_codon:yes gene_type:complete